MDLKKYIAARTDGGRPSVDWGMSAKERVPNSVNFNTSAREKIIFKRDLLLGILIISFCGSSFSQEICKSVPTVFKQESVYSGSKLNTSFKQMLCSAEKSTQGQSQILSI